MSADLNSDGMLDFAVLDEPSGASNVTLLLAEGAGEFAGRELALPGITRTHAIAVGDWSADGRTDLLVAGSDGIWLGDIWQREGPSWLKLVTGNSPFAVQTGDVNADGFADILASNEGSSSVSVWLSHGAKAPASRSTPIEVSTGPAPRALAVADWNQDGRADFAVACAAKDGQPPRVEIYLASSGDSFHATPTVFELASAPQALATGDLNRDRVPDLVVATPAALGWTVMLGLGDGRFEAHPTQLQDSPYGFAIGDWNRDGLADVATLNKYAGSSAATVSVDYGRGDGSFRWEQLSDWVNQPTGIALGDYDGDGLADLAVLNQGLNGVSLMRGSIGGQLPTLSSLPVGKQPNALAVADFDANGQLDIATANSQSNDVSVLYAESKGQFAPSATRAVGTTPRSLLARDLNLDSRPDLALTTSAAQRLELLFSRAGRTFSELVTYATTPISATLSGPTSVAAGDLNRDGLPDLVTANYDSNREPSTVSVFLARSAGRYANRVDYPTQQGPRFVTIGDLDADGSPELAVANSYSQSVSVFRGRGDGTFASRVDLLGGAAWLGIADFTGDGRADLLAVRADQLSVMASQADGTLLAPLDSPLGSTAGGLPSARIADFDRDGRLDVAGCAPRGSYLQPFFSACCVLRGRGDGTFREPRCFVAGRLSAALEVADLNGDGWRDLVVANSAADSVSMFMTTCESGPR